VVADHHRIPCRHAEALQHGLDMSGVRLLHRQAVPAQNQGEKGRKAQAGQQRRRRRHRLVGADGERPATRGQCGQSRHHARIGAGEIGGMGFQILQEGRDERLLQCHAARRAGLGEQRAGAIADHRRHLGQREGVQALRHHVAIEGGRDVRRAVHQRAVEVEDGEGHAALVAACCPPAQAATPWPCAQPSFSRRVRAPA
jgi:hypothetical protein